MLDGEEKQHLSVLYCLWTCLRHWYASQADNLHCQESSWTSAYSVYF